MHLITSLDQLSDIYGTPKAPALVKVSDRMTVEYRQFVEAAPFLALATSGPEGLDCSPRGDVPGFVRIFDDKTLMVPDRAGNNRVDSLANIVRDPRVSLMFMIPGVSSIIRVNGDAVLSIEPELLTSFEVAGKAPRSVMVVTIREVYFQCARALMRSRLWDADAQVDAATLPTPGQILAAMTNGREGGAAYDHAWPERAQKTMW